MNEEQRQLDEQMEIDRRRCEERQQEERQYDDQMAYDQMAAEVARLREAARWIPTAERLPERGHYVELIIHVYLDRKYWWLKADGVRVDALPEHHGVAWRPLPEPPEVTK